MGKNILLIGTLDTKAEEVGYVRDLIERRGYRVTVMDVGVLGYVAFQPDISRQEVATASGTDLEKIATYGDEAKAMAEMARGATKIAVGLFGNGKLDGILAIGGTMGTDLALSVTKALPFGVPKLIVSSVAFSRLIAPDLIAADLMMILWTGGLWGLNSMCRQVLDSAAGAITGAAESYRSETAAVKQRIGITSLGSSDCKYLYWLKPALEERGYEVVVFHTVGMGGMAFEQLVADGTLSAVLDLCLIEVSDHALGSTVSAGSERLEAASKKGVPQIVAPGCITAIDWSTWEPVPTRFRNRDLHVHNRLISGFKTTKNDKLMVAKVIAEKLNDAVGPTVVIIPTQGLEEWDRPGGPFYDPEGLKAFTRQLRRKINPRIDIVEVDAHINDKAFADKALALFDEMVGTIKPAQ